MRKLTNVTCGDQYTDAATLSDVIDSSGGYFNVSGADVWMEVQYGIQGQTNFTDEVHIPIGGGVLVKGTTGVRFRNFVPGSNAVVTAALSEKTEPPIQISATGQSAVNPSSSGAMQLIQNQLLLASQTPVSFTNIPQTFGHLLIVCRARSDQAASGNCFIRFNTDAGANYDWIFKGISGSTAFAATSSFATNQAYAGEFANASSAAGNFGAGEILIPGYSDTVRQKSYKAHGYTIDTAIAQTTARDAGGTWRNTQAITQIDIYTSNIGVGKWVAGSEFTLYGLNIL